MERPVALTTWCAPRPRPAGLAGTPLRFNGSLTIVALADEAGVKGHLLAHRHTDLTDLKDEFYARGRVPDSERKLSDDLTTALGRIKELVAENNKLQEANDTLARIINVLEVERHGLRAGAGRTGQLVALPSANHR